MVRWAEREGLATNIQRLVYSCLLCPVCAPPMGGLLSCEPPSLRCIGGGGVVGKVGWPSLHGRVLGCTQLGIGTLHLFACVQHISHTPQSGQAPLQLPGDPSTFVAVHLEANNTTWDGVPFSDEKTKRNAHTMAFSEGGCPFGLSIPGPPSAYPHRPLVPPLPFLCKPLLATTHGAIGPRTILFDAHTHLEFFAPPIRLHSTTQPNMLFGYCMPPTMGTDMAAVLMPVIFPLRFADLRWQGVCSHFDYPLLSEPKTVGVVGPPSFSSRHADPKVAGVSGTHEHNQLGLFEGAWWDTDPGRCGILRGLGGAQKHGQLGTKAQSIGGIRGGLVEHKNASNRQDLIVLSRTKGPHALKHE